MAFPGTIDVRPETLKSLIRDYCVSLERNGFKNIIILPWHGGDFKPVQEATDELNQSLRQSKVTSYTDLVGLLRFFAESSLKHGISAPESGDHAGESETSIVLALRKDLVDMEHAEQGFVGNYEEKIPIIFSQGIKAVTKNGVVGDPCKAEAGKGEEYLELWADKMVDFIRKMVDI